MQKMILNTIDISPLLKAYQALNSAVGKATNDLGRAGAILYFEFCYELAWKVMRKILLSYGKELNSPKPVFREAAKEGLISDPTLWFTFVEKRNLTTHTYQEEIAKEIYDSLPIFKEALARFIEKIQTL